MDIQESESSEQEIMVDSESHINGKNKESILYHLIQERICYLHLPENKRYLSITENCDEYFKTYLTKTQVRQWIDELTQVMEEMVEK